MHRRGEEIKLSDLIMSIRWFRLFFFYRGEIFPLISLLLFFAFLLQFLFAGWVLCFWPEFLYFDLFGGFFFLRFILIFSWGWLNEIPHLLRCGPVWRDGFFYLLENGSLKFTLKTRLLKWINRSTEPELHLELHSQHLLALLVSLVNSMIWSIHVWYLVEGGLAGSCCKRKAFKLLKLQQK